MALKKHLSKPWVQSAVGIAVGSVVLVPLVMTAKSYVMGLIRNRAA